MLRGLCVAASAAALSVAVAAAANQPQFMGPTLKHPGTPPDFALRDQDGRLVRLASQRGKVALITFLYTHCPDLCPLTAQNLNDMLRSLGAKRQSVTVLALSVDPSGDTPRAVDNFVRNHRLLPQFHYLTGTEKVRRSIWRAYKVQAIPQGEAGVDHTLYTLMIDPGGKARVLFDVQARPAAIAHDVRLVPR